MAAGDASIGKIVTHDCVEPKEQLQQSLDILRCSPVHDVEVLRGDWRAMKKTCGSSYDDEFNSRLDQLDDKSLRINDPSGAPRRNLVANTAMATPARKRSNGERNKAN